jgi:hypothetical protein
MSRTLFSLLNVQANIVQNAMEADRLYPFALLHDLFIEGGRLSSWNLGQHSDLFPDRLPAGLAFAISHRAEIWLQLYATLNVALYFAVAWYFFSIHRACHLRKVQQSASSFRGGITRVRLLRLFHMRWNSRRER